MSSFSLISHHLFVAAVNEKSCTSQVPGRMDSLPAAPEVQIREVPIELIDFGRPLPNEASFPFGAIRRPRRIG
jgi:hypothetical protein